MNERIGASDAMQIETIRALMARDGVVAVGIIDEEIIRADGRMSRDRFHNLVTDAGLAYILTNDIRTGLFVGLLGASPTIAAGTGLGDITEVTDYTGDRQAYTGALTDQTVSNAGARAEFTFTDDAVTYGGAFLTDQETGTVGVLVAGRARSGGNQVMNTGDIVRITYSITIARPA